MVKEFTIKSDFKSPNSKLDDDKKVYYQSFKKGDVVAGLVINGNGQIKRMVVDKNGFLFTDDVLEKIKDTPYKTFDEYEKNKTKISKDDLPPEIAEQINKVAKNYLPKKIKQNQINITKYALIGTGLGIGIALLWKKNPYLFGILGLLGGVMVANRKVTK